MSFWKKLTGQTATLNIFPIKISLLEGKLTVQIFLHDLKTQHGLLSCWTYVTDGLTTLKQKELVFTLRRDKGEKQDDFPKQPLFFFEAVYNLALQGETVDIGNYTEAQGGCLGFPAIAYSSYQQIPTVQIPSAALIAIGITSEELQALKTFGFSRIMARLGEFYRYYPCPPWSDRKRPSISFQKTFEKSMLTRFNKVDLYGTRAILINNHLFVRFMPGTGKSLSDTLRQASFHLDKLQVPYISAELDPEANGCKVWDPSNQETNVIVPFGSNGSQLSGCCVIFFPSNTHEGAVFFEDGFMISIKETTWLAILNAISQESVVTIESSNQNFYSVTIEWNTKAYSNVIPQTT